jgi:hypothetical protein
MFRVTQSVDRELCFILMPFRPELACVYETIQKVLVLQHRMRCLRGDDIYAPGIIMSDVWTKICEAHIVVADATDRNPNVFYEMGLAHAIGKTVIILAQREEDIPFDLRHHRIVFYEPDRLDSLEVRLFRAIQPLKWDPPEIKEWIDTNVNQVRLGLSSPTNGTVVSRTPIEASGRVEGVQLSDQRFFIQGFVTTDREYEQGAGWITRDGCWRITGIHLGATTHDLFFRIYDGSGRPFAESHRITIRRLNPT